MLAASNNRQHTRLFKVLGRPEMGHKDYEYRRQNFQSEAAELQKILMEKTAQEWEDFFQANHVPALRVRTMPEALQDPQVNTRKILHRHENVPGVDGPLTVPMCAFKFEHGGPSIETPPPRVGEHNADVLGSLGYSAADIAALHAEGVV
jgi:crotonobetainyl-CoA:carnitine CoA-transferase CaiB-like acyl-CoA transferase